jgi:protein-S-isoprenylcysteine O-methyltransferase Ste14
MSDESPGSGVDFSLIFWNALPATLWLFNAVGIAKHTIESGEPPELSRVLLLIEVIIIGLFFLLRRAPMRVSWHPYDVAIALFGTFTPLLIGLEPQPSNGLWLGGTLQAIGLALVIPGVFSLGRSFGMVAANRGVKTNGMYRLVRHPLYSSYLVIHTGFFVNHPTPFVAIILILSFGAQILRIRQEEALLMLDPEYVAYAERVRYRLLPPIY